ncbi:MAG TPA: hypothetical protein VMU69_19800 [Bradyrhizobium sp.]|nr:hypothetical protein [Bradyrhizobium sp.]
MKLDGMKFADIQKAMAANQASSKGFKASMDKLSEMQRATAEAEKEIESDQELVTADE